MSTGRSPTSSRPLVSRSEVNGRQVSRGSVPVGSSFGSLWGNDYYFSPSSVTPSTQVAASVGPHGFAGAFSSSRSLTHVSFAMVPQGSLVPHGGRPGCSDFSVVGVVRWWLQEDRWGFGVPLRVPPPSLLAAYRLVSVGLGSPLVRSDSFMFV